MRSTERDLAFTEFVHARQGHLRRVAYAACGDWHLADDLVQTALARLYVAWPRIQRAGAEEAYARRIILRARVDETRRPWRREQPGLDGVDRPVVDGSAGLDERDVIVRALQQLPAMQRRTVILRHWIGLSVDQTADELGISPGTVKSHNARAVARLRDLLGDSDEPIAATTTTSKETS